MRLYTLHCVSVRIISCFVLFCCFFAKFFPLVYFAIQKTHFVHNIRGFFLRKSDGNAKRQLNKHIHDTRGEVQIWWNKEHKRIEGKAEKTVNLSIYASQMKRQMRMGVYALVYFNQMSNTLIWNYLSNFFSLHWHGASSKISPHHFSTLVFGIFWQKFSLFHLMFVYEIEQFSSLIIHLI